MGWQPTNEIFSNYEESRERSVQRHNQWIVERDKRLITDILQLIQGLAAGVIFAVFMYLLWAVLGP